MARNNYYLFGGLLFFFNITFIWYDIKFFSDLFCISFNLEMMKKKKKKNYLLQEERKKKKKEKKGKS